MPSTVSQNLDKNRENFATQKIVMARLVWVMMQKGVSDRETGTETRNYQLGLQPLPYHTDPYTYLRRVCDTKDWFWLNHGHRFYGYIYEETENVIEKGQV